MRTWDDLSFARTITSAALIAVLSGAAGGQAQSPPAKQAAPTGEQAASPGATVIEQVWSVAAQRDGRAGLIVDVVVTSPGNSEFSLQLFDAEHAPLRSGGANEQLPAFRGRVLDGKPEAHVEFFTLLDVASPAIEPGERLIARITARGKQGAGSAEAIITVPNEGRAPPEALLRFAGVRQESGQTAPQTLDVGGMGRDIRNPEPSPNGTRVLLDVEAQGLRRRAVTTTVWAAMVGEMVTTTAFRSQFGHENARRIGQHEQPVNANTVRFNAIDYFVRDSDRKPLSGEGEYAMLACVARCGSLEATWDAPLAERKGWVLRTESGQEIVLLDSTADRTQPEVKGTDAADNASKPREKETQDTNSAAPTTLHEAASAGDVAAVRRFLADGADAFGTDPRECTPLHLAARAGHVEVAELLIDAVQKKVASEPAGEIQLLGETAGRPAGLFSGADEPEKSDGGETGETLSFDDYLKSISFDNYLEENMPLEISDDRGRTPLHYAAKGDHAAVVQLLVSRGADVNAADLRGLTPLHLAAMANAEVTVGILLGAGADPTLADEDDDTPQALATSRRIQRRLESIAALRAGGPAAQAAAEVVEAYVAAVKAGDTATLRRLFTSEFAQEMRGMLTVLSGRPALIEHQLWGVQVEGESANASVWMRDPKRQGFAREVLIDMAMKRVGDDWRIAKLSFQPYSQTLDAQEDAE